jgi:CP family cyanate transporter-like MFS transporter
MVWAAPVALTAALIAGFTPNVARAPGRGPARWWPDWKDPRMWRIGLMQGGCGTIYFGANAFIPDYLHAIGQPDLVGACLGALNAGQLPASFLILLFAGRLAGRKKPVVAVGLLAFVGIACLLSEVPWVMIAGATLDGFAAGFILILTLALPPLLAAPDDVHRLSAGSYAIGYAGSFLLPLLGGVVVDATDIVATAFLPVAAGGALVLLIAATMPPRAAAAA